MCKVGGVIWGHRRGEGLKQIKHLPQSPFTGQFLRKADIKDWSLLVISSMFCTFLKRFQLQDSTSFFNYLSLLLHSIVWIKSDPREVLLNFSHMIVYEYRIRIWIATQAVQILLLGNITWRYFPYFYYFYKWFLILEKMYLPPQLNIRKNVLA